MCCVILTEEREPAPFKGPKARMLKSNGIEVVPGGNSGVMEMV